MTRRNWCLAAALLALAGVAGYGAIRSFCGLGDKSCPVQAGDKSATGVHASADSNGPLPSGHPDLSALPPGHPDISAMDPVQAPPLSDAQLASADAGQCPYLAETGRKRPAGGADPGGADIQAMADWVAGTPKDAGRTP